MVNWAIQLFAIQLSIASTELCELVAPHLQFSEKQLTMGDSDSENEGSQTNVNRLVIRPPGHTGDIHIRKCFIHFYLLTLSNTICPPKFVSLNISSSKFILRDLHHLHLYLIYFQAIICFKSRVKTQNIVFSHRETNPNVICCQERHRRGTLPLRQLLSRQTLEKLTLSRYIYSIFQVFL